MCRRRCRPSRARRSGRSRCSRGRRSATRSPPARASSRSTRHRPNRLAPPRNRPAGSGIARDDDHAAQFRVRPERVAQRTRRVERPEVLILEVDQRCARSRRPSCRRGRCCARRRERTDRASAVPDRCGAPGARGCHAAPAPAPAARDHHVRGGVRRQPVAEHSPRARHVERVGILPPFAERERDVGDRRARDRSCMSCHGGRSP